MNLDIEPTISFFERLIATGAVPPNVVRFVVDSGDPGGVPKIYWECFATKGFLDVLVDEMRIRIGPPSESADQLEKDMRKGYRQILLDQKAKLEAKLEQTKDWTE